MSGARGGILPGHRDVMANMHLSSGRPATRRWGGRRDGGCSPCRRTRISSASSAAAWRRREVQSIAASRYLGRRVCFGAMLRTYGVTDWAGLWLRVDGPGGTLVIDNMHDRALRRDHGLDRGQHRARRGRGTRGPALRRAAERRRRRGPHQAAVRGGRRGRTNDGPAAPGRTSSPRLRLSDQSFSERAVVHRAHSGPAYIPAVAGNRDLAILKSDTSTVASMCRYTEASRKYFSTPTSSIAPYPPCSSTACWQT